jgi:hypothetical protein
MTNYVDLGELKGNVYFGQATLDDRFFWEEIQPDPKIAEVANGRWFDGTRRFRLLDCAHKETYRDGDLCTFCGHQFPHKATKTTARKTPRSGK